MIPGYHKIKKKNRDANLSVYNSSFLPVRPIAVDLGARALIAHSLEQRQTQEVCMLEMRVRGLPL